MCVDDRYALTGIITIRDIDMMNRFPHACMDKLGRLRVGAAVGVHDYKRARSLIQTVVHWRVVDWDNGHSKNVSDTVRELKKRWDIDLVAGNVATRDGAKEL